jgi:hypothetical protein
MNQTNSTKMSKKKVIYELYETIMMMMKSEVKNVQFFLYICYEIM